MCVCLVFFLSPPPLARLLVPKPLRKQLQGTTACTCNPSFGEAEKEGVLVLTG